MSVKRRRHACPAGNHNTIHQRTGKSNRKKFCARNALLSSVFWIKTFVFIAAGIAAIRFLVALSSTAEPLFAQRNARRFPA